MEWSFGWRNNEAIRHERIAVQIVVAGVIYFPKKPGR
jgi:hypothetical protein